MHKEILLFIIYLVELFGEVGLSKNTKQFAFFFVQRKSQQNSCKNLSNDKVTGKKKGSLSHHCKTRLEESSLLCHQTRHKYDDILMKFSSSVQLFLNSSLFQLFFL